MSTGQTKTTVNRRSLAKGAAWAAPAIVATAAVPAYAASRCVTKVTQTSYLDFNFGREYSTNTQIFKLFLQSVTVTDIPANRTVVAIELDAWFEQRDNTSQYQAGVPAFTHSSAYVMDSNRRFTSTGGATSRTYYDAQINWAGASWSQIGKDVQLQHPNGQTYKSWGLRTRWDSSVAGDPRNSTVTKKSGSTQDCYTFTLPNMGLIQAQYRSVRENFTDKINNFRIIRVFFDDGSYIETPATYNQTSEVIITR